MSDWNWSSSARPPQVSSFSIITRCVHALTIYQPRSSVPASEDKLPHPYWTGRAANVCTRHVSAFEAPLRLLFRWNGHYEERRECLRGSHAPVCVGSLL